MSRIEKFIAISILFWMFFLFLVQTAIAQDISAMAGLIRGNEGLVLKPYKDPSGKHICCGYGHNLTTKGFTIDEAEFLLSGDIEMAIGELRAVFGPSFDTFSSPRQIALVDMMFCMGPGTFSQFRNMITNIKKGHWKSASTSLKDSVWYKKHPTRAKKILVLFACPNNEIPTSVKLVGSGNVIKLPTDRMVYITDPNSII